MIEPQSLEELRTALKSTFETEPYIQAIDELVDKLEFVRAGTIELTACEKVLGSIFIKHLTNERVCQRTRIIDLVEVLN